MLEINSPVRRAKRKLLLIEKIALFLSKTQGRDKLCKLLQYLFRFLAACYEIDSYRNIKYNSLYESARQARKIFRLFKSINEYEGMAYILFNEDESLTNLLKLLSRACYFFYWAFDNVSILAKIKLFRLDYEKLYKIGYGFWFSALAFNNIGLMIELFFGKQEQKRLVEPKQYVSKIPQNCPLIADFLVNQQEEFVQLTEDQKQKIRREKWLKLIKNSFDLIPAGKQSQVLEVIFNRVIPQKMAGVCGFISSVISIYQIAKEINQNN